MKMLSVALALVALAGCRTTANSSVSETESARNSSKKSPDSYLCTSSSGLELSYITGGLDGKPSLQIDMACPSAGPDSMSCQSVFQILSAHGDQVSVKSKDSGLIVSSEVAIPDHSVTTYSINLPKGLKVGLGEAVKFDAKLKIVTSPTSIMGPLPGQHSTTKEESMKCVARFVVF